MAVAMSVVTMITLAICYILYHQYRCLVVIGIAVLCSYAFVNLMVLMSCVCYNVLQSAVPPEVTIILHPQESMSAATAYTSISLVVQFTRLYPHEYAFFIVH